jgi:hypothetical protein
MKPYRMNVPRWLGAGALLAAAVCTTAQAADFNALQLLNQTQFRLFSEDVAAAVSFKPMIPSEGLGITGFDIGVSVGATEVANRAVLIQAAGGADVPKAVPIGAVRVHKGLPFDIDIGVVAAQLPETNVKATGGELRWAFIGGSTLVPAVALRLSAMNLSGVDQLKMSTASADLSISKGFANLTPYAGVGTVQVKSKPQGVATLRDEKFNLTKVFAGLNIAFVPFAFLIEADKTGEATSYGLKLALRW